MRKYKNAAIKELANQLAGGLRRLRQSYVDAAEALIQIVSPSRSYPYEFIVYRLTGYRPPRDELPLPPMRGKSLRADLQSLMFDVCDSFELRVSDYEDEVLDTRAMARKFNVSTKTIQRWRHRGLPARRLVFPDGRRRVAFLASSVDQFTRKRRRQVARSSRFTQMDESERLDLLRRARRMAGFTRCTLGEVSRRLAARTGRAVETVRYTLRKHDLDNSDAAIFPAMSAPLDDSDKAHIYHCFLRGASAPELAKQFRRTRGSIYRIVAEMRARRLLDRPISYMYNPQFELPNADEIILGDRGGAEEGDDDGTIKPPPDLPAYLRSLYDVPLLDREQERDLFRRYNYLKYRADMLRRDIDPSRARTSQLKEIERLLLRANGVKNQIVRANLRLVVSIAKRHLRGPQTLFELISDGNVSLMQAVEKFDYGRGNRFSTYASWAIMRNFARSVPKERYQLDRFATGNDELLDIASALQTYDPDEMRLPELRESIETVLTNLSPRERTIVTGHYGLDSDEQSKTLDQLGRKLGLSKERVRQIELQAFRKLRRLLEPQQADLLG